MIEDDIMTTAEWLTLECVFIRIYPKDLKKGYWRDPEGTSNARIKAARYGWLLLHGRVDYTKDLLAKTAKKYHPFLAHLAILRKARVKKWPTSGARTSN